jgi:enoyl-CoA hydratase/carnithine racemase
MSSSDRLDEGCYETDRRMREALAHANAREGVASFLERRPPRFSRWKGEPP